MKQFHIPPKPDDLLTVRGEGVVGVHEKFDVANCSANEVERLTAGTYICHVYHNMMTLLWRTDASLSHKGPVFSYTPTRRTPSQQRPPRNLPPATLTPKHGLVPIIYHFSICIEHDGLMSSL